MVGSREMFFGWGDDDGDDYDLYNDDTYVDNEDSFFTDTLPSDCELEAYYAAIFYGDDYLLVYDDESLFLDVDDFTDQNTKATVISNYDDGYFHITGKMLSYPSIPHAENIEIIVYDEGDDYDDEYKDEYEDDYLVDYSYMDYEAILKLHTVSSFMSNYDDGNFHINGKMLNYIFGDDSWPAGYWRDLIKKLDAHEEEDDVLPF